MFVLFFALWIIFNGRITVEIVLFGIVVAGLLFGFLCRFMDYGIKKELRVYANLLRGVSYIILLVKEIFKANVDVMRLIVSVKYEVEPALVKFRTDIKSDTLRVVLANSITLTPGTITVTLEGDEYLVHCLDKDMGKEIADSEFVHRLHAVECGGKEEAWSGK